MSADPLQGDDVLQTQEMLRTGLPPANDRMLTTCFLAALLHGIIILGVTFSAQRTDADGSDAPPLEVVLVSDAAPEAARNAHARYAAQRTQLGSGNTLLNERARIPKSGPAGTLAANLADAAGVAGTAGELDASAGAGAESLIATRVPSVKIVYFAAPTSTDAAPRPELSVAQAEVGMAQNDEGIELRLRGEARHALWVTADTRESDVAVYLDGWRRKIERVGTLNFPDAARRRNLSGTPVLEVTIGADGRLVSTRVRRSSGHAEIDEAALRILKLASPYDPFPKELNATHDEIRIAYEWQFLGGESGASSVYVPAP